MNREELKPGVKVKHFKNELWLDSIHPDRYTYEIIGVAHHTETKEELVVYKALYDDVNNHIQKGDIFCRPISMFLSMVDTKKYPYIKQRYRFEIVN